MEYVSTRGGTGFTFSDAIVSGFAPDGGLFVPRTIPHVSQQDLLSWARLSFPDLCVEIATRFIPQEEISRSDIAAIAARSFAPFTDPQVIRMANPTDGIFVAELFHGPTYAFKDIGLQFLGNLLEHILSKRRHRVSILVATSGDTGSAAIHGVMNKPSLELFVLFPKGKISAFQQRQMSTVDASNVHVLAVEGNSDSLDLVLREIAADKRFCEDNKVSYINSFNWGRIMIQAAHYFFAYLRVEPQARKKVSFAIPTGAMGNLVAGYLAVLMGLPVEQLVVATNSNDILHRFFQAGDFSRKEVLQTLSPSMDIQAPYNFERFLYFASRDATLVRTQYERYEKTGVMEVSRSSLGSALDTISSASISESRTIEVIREVSAKTGYLLDPHTAVGFGAALHFQSSKKLAPIICLATAHPCKFEEAVIKATSRPPPFPGNAKGIMEKREVHLDVSPSEDVVALLKGLIAKNFHKGASRL